MNSIDQKKDFMKRVNVLIDTREQKNAHITVALDKLGIRHESHKLDFGDYSFSIDSKDFSCSCVIERKATIDEVYGNVTTDRERIEKELETISKNANQCTFLIENCDNWNSLKGYEIPTVKADKQGRKVKNIGATVYSTLQAWKCQNRYGFEVEFISDNAMSAAKILEIFFWYWHNYKKQISRRNNHE